MNRQIKNVPTNSKEKALNTNMSIFFMNLIQLFCCWYKSSYKVSIKLWCYLIFSVIYGFYGDFKAIFRSSFIFFIKKSAFYFAGIKIIYTFATANEGGGIAQLVRAHDS
jgi:hypothetical protein